MAGRKNALVRLLASYLVWTAAAVLGGSFINLYFKSAGVGMFDQVLSFFFWASAPVLAIRAMNRVKFDVRAAMLFGVALEVVAYSLLVFASPSSTLFFLYAFLIGLTCFFFWVPFNAMYFELGKGLEARLGSVYYSANPVLSLFLPLAGGLLAQSYGFAAVFIATALVLVALIPFLLLTLGSKRFSYDLSSCLAGLKGFKTLVLLEGVYGGGIAAATSLIVLFYFRSPFELGAFLSVTTIFAVIASFFVSRLSDASRKRKKYIRFFGSALALSTLIASFASGAFAWAAAMSLRNFFASLFYPFAAAIFVENREKISEGMVGREWLLNWGRIAGVVLVLFFTAFWDIRFSLIPLGFAMLAYPAVVELKKRHITIA